MELVIAPILAILGLILLLVIIKEPFWGLIAFTIMLYLPPASLVPMLGQLHLSRLIAAFTFIIYLLKRNKVKKQRPKVEKQTKMIYFLIFFMFCSVVTSIWRSNTIGYCFTLLKVFLGYFLVIGLVTSTKKIKIIIWTMMSSGMVVGLLSLRDYSGFGRLSSRYSGMFLNPNDFALCFMILLPFVIYFFLHTRNFLSKVLLSTYSVIYIYCIFLTSSRGAFISGSIMLAAMILKSKNRVIGFICGILAAILLFNFMPENFKERIQTISTASTQDANSISRVDAWKAGFSMMRSKLFGVGLGNFGEGFFIYRPASAVDVVGKRRAAHNFFIQIGGEIGVFGLFVFISLILSSLKSLVRVNKYLRNKECTEKDTFIMLSNSVYVSLISFCAAAMFLSQAYNWIFYYLIAFSVVVERLAHDNIETDLEVSTS